MFINLCWYYIIYVAVDIIRKEIDRAKAAIVGGIKTGEKPELGPYRFWRYFIKLLDRS